jgi:hypothetical protein
MPLQPQTDRARPVAVSGSGGWLSGRRRMFHGEEPMVARDGDGPVRLAAAALLIARGASPIG